MDGGVKYDLSTLEFKNREKLEDFHGRILILQQKIMFYGETVFHIKLLFRYMKSLPKSERIKAFIAPKMIYLITLPDKKVKYEVYTGGNIRGIYRYL